MFSNLFNKATFNDDDDDCVEKQESSDRAKEATSSKPASHSDGNLYINMPIELYSGEGEELIQGRVDSINSNEVTIRRNLGKLSFPIVESGTPAVLRTYTKSMRPLNYDVIIKESSRAHYIILVGPEHSYTEHRLFYRLPVQSTVNISLFDTSQKNSKEECKLRNISSTGLCFVSSKEYAIDTPIYCRIKLKPNYGELVLLGEVIRSQNTHRGIEYGVLFAQLSAKDEGAINSQMIQYQSDLRKAEEGYI